ncbi:WD40 repeat-like protein, partial [Suillus weaverae]
MTLEGHEPYIISITDGDDKEFKGISCISYFPHGKQMISGSGDKTIRRWDLREGKEIKEARETGIVRTFHEGNWITCIDISADSTLLAGGSIDGIRIWNLDTGELVAGPFKISDIYVNALQFSADSRKLAVLSGWKFLQVWDIQTVQKLVVTRETFSGVFSRIYSPIFWTTKHKSIVSTFNFTSDDPVTTIYELDASTLEPVGDPFEGHVSTINGLALSFDCVLLASASDDKTIKLWSFESRQ